ncbi:hypothetical protein [Rathayibacter agropyri]
MFQFIAEMYEGIGKVINDEKGGGCMNGGVALDAVVIDVPRKVSARNVIGGAESFWVLKEGAISPRILQMAYSHRRLPSEV